MFVGRDTDVITKVITTTVHCGDGLSQVDEDYSGRIDWSEFMQMIGRNIEHEGALARSVNVSVADASPEGDGNPPTSPAKGGKGRKVRRFREAPGQPGSQSPPQTRLTRA